MRQGNHNGDNLDLCLGDLAFVNRAGSSPAALTTSAGSNWKVVMHKF